MKLSLSALLVFVGFTMVSCEKEEAKCHSVARPPQEFLDYWFFPQGSYWVYELENNPGILDTVTVVESQERYYNPDEFAARVPCNMVYRQALAHSNDSIFTPTSGNPQSLEKYEAFQNSLYVESLFNVSQFPAGVAILNLPVQEGRQVSAGVVMADTSVYMTPANEMAETVEIQHVNAPASSPSPIAKSLFFTKNVGITKRVYSNNRVWNLIEYKINKQ